MITLNLEQQFLSQLQKERLTASIKDPKSLDQFLETDVKIGSLLTGNISVIKKYVDVLKKNERFVFLHLEKIEGISYDKEGLKFVAKFFKPHGIISTKSSLIKIAKSLDLLTIQRLFLVDSDAMKRGLDSINRDRPTAVEVMPGIIPKAIKELSQNTNVPIITGGLFKNKNQMIEALEHGAIAVSSGTPKLWKEKL